MYLSLLVSVFTDLVNPLCINPSLSTGKKIEGVFFLELK